MKAFAKGGVEGEIGRFRRRDLVPVPRVASLAALKAHLAAFQASACLDVNAIIRGPSDATKTGA